MNLALEARVANKTLEYTRETDRNWRFRREIFESVMHSFWKKTIREKWVI